MNVRCSKCFTNKNGVNHPGAFLILRFLSSTHRCVFHHHAVVRLEGDRHHAGQLLATVHPEIPAQTLLASQLLQADLLELISKKYFMNRKTRYWGVFIYLYFFYFCCCCVGDSSDLHRLCLDAALKAARMSRTILDGCVSNITHDSVTNLLICALCSHPKAMQLSRAPRGPS